MDVGVVTVRIEAEVWQPVEQPVEDDPQLEASQVHPEAHVRSVGEGEVLARVRARQQEAVGLDVRRRISIGGGQGHDHEVAALDLRPSDFDVAGGEAVDTHHRRFEAQMYAFRADEGGRHTPFFSNYRPQFHIRTTHVDGGIDLGEATMVMPGDAARLVVTLGQPVALDVGLGFAVREGGRTVAAGTVTALLD